MDRKVRIHRLGLLLAYALTTVLAQAGSLHGHHAPSRARCESACDDSRPHLSGHASPDLGHDVGECPACQVRSLPGLIDLAGPSPLPIRGAVAALAEPPTVVLPCLLHPSCRAPPLI